MNHGLEPERLGEYVRGEWVDLEGDDEELGLAEVRAQHDADVLGVGEVEGSVDLVEDVHRGRLEEQQREDEGEREQGPAQ